MIRSLVLLFNLAGVLFLNFLFDGGVSLEMNAPSTVEAGKDFQVEITINKGQLEGFSRFQQLLPAGLKAISDNAANADFSFKDHRVRLIWLRMPDQQTVTLTYNVHVDPRLKGNFTIGGKFSYIYNNQRQSVDVDPVSVTITPSPDIDPSLIVDINDFEKKVIPDLTPAATDQVICIRQKPIVTAPGEFTVNLLVNKAGKEKFAKIEENIPAGYRAISGETKDAIFTFKDQTAKFLWMNLPSPPYFIVSYKIIAQEDVSSLPPLDIKGTFSYIEDGKTEVVDITQTDTNIKNASQEELKQLLLSVPQMLTQKAGGTSNTGNGNETAREQEEQQLAETNTNQPVTKPGPAPVKKRTSQSSRLPKIPEAYILQPREGIYYRVQVAAGHRPVNVKRYFRKYHLQDTVRAEMHEGWHKYSVGTFREYKQARDFRVHIWNTTTINDAFVSAYNSGRRITVQEALMITNQKWYK